MWVVDPDDPGKGLRFDGRLSEDFKLLTGTWVHVGRVGLDMLACLAPFAADLVIARANRNEIGLLNFPDLAEVTRAGFTDQSTGDTLVDPLLLGEVRRGLSGHAATGASSSTRVSRALVLSEPPSMAAGEMTAKGNLNLDAVLARRADLPARLYDDGDASVAKL